MSKEQALQIIISAAEAAPLPLAAHRQVADAIKVIMGIVLVGDK